MNKSKKETTILNYGPLLTILMITIFVVIPMTVIWVLSSSIFNNVLIKELKWVIILVLMISIFGILINLLFVYLKIISIRSFNFNIPVIFAFIGLIFSSLYLNEIWQVFLITLSSAIISAIVINFLIGWVEDLFIKKNKQKEELAIKEKLRKIEQSLDEK
ncbi:MAG3450 family membrane protein [Mycoplasma tauri]|uniref:Uncharacterized protein n=2 Tax=Mycoplasma tauri TaxID=547987 RepID=A0A953NCW9_9MOLU|nr:hypothetical protein [Mycoplasma tauri]MBZ4195546.1 hypothetical protein [Mycoplasma tauri]MBZ4204139.1 hypothetical protein [Mycoplasma tauri]MBZ4218114.1 hypothetical protein [Mycoplasma tauri]MBZ4226487.1 hypothetical protein [Mycoplasma tauri]QSB07797.1 hypothetical protein JS510_01590 [Mycoplasma tauri]